MEHFDVMIVGAGLSGVGAACHLQQRHPRKSFVILERRNAMGGTWDLFRYPGVRSDSDMYTLGYRFRPWRDAKAIADAPSILNYIRETAAEFGVDKEIRYEHRVRHASWSSADALWAIEADTGEAETENSIAQFTCNFLYLCTGYYDYEAGYTPDWSDVKRFRGRIVHPQKWPADLDYEGKRVVVIGSGATAVTLVPAMAERAAHVTMLQRSPTYVVSRPAEDKIANTLRSVLPARAAYALTRWKNVLLQMFFYNLARTRPDLFKWMLARGVRNHLGEQYDLKHFTPKYNPWDQRLCLVPDSDLFNAIRDGRATVVTDQIETFTETGLQLKSGQHLNADIIVTATGLVLKLMSGLQLTVDGAPVDLSQTITYKGMMYSDVPNLASAFGYTNGSWTLKCDLTSEYVCRLLKHMDQHGYAQCTPRLNDPELTAEPAIDFTSSYVLRALHTLPRQGSKTPWRLHQNYMKDLSMFRFGRVDDGTMEFKARPGGRNADAGVAQR
ncbi:MAG TPA: NAD(P)/FAD-dependent oxidoreductase [Pyrinomonadaceae bacterium]|jgi:cation diffusion facilitator CzcD-associated flavoprotein CzcO|nr:NAD(P)/FAD-dependent oxidoreductase [Pyrinomonadaceae bacterium]